MTPLRATGLRNTVGRTFCALVWDSDISINYGPLNGQLKGANLGVAAFEVLSVQTFSGGSSSSLPKVTLRILDANVVCEAPLQRFLDAPAPSSSSTPSDTQAMAAPR